MVGINRGEAHAMENIDSVLNLFDSRNRGVFYSLYPLPPYENKDAGGIRTIDHLHALLLEENTADAAAHIYIHIPFCDSFCAFCAIPKRIAAPDLIANYLEALKQEIAMYADKAYIQSCQFRSLYLGGGTPSVLSPEQLGWILDFCRDTLPIEKDAEITVEGSTHNFDEEKLDAALEKGANRVSYGIQSFNDTLRQTLGLQDNAQDAVNALNTARKAGFKEMDIDLIYNLPGQNEEDVEEDFRIAADLGLENISFYPLHLGEGTRLHDQAQTGKISPGDKALEIRMYLKAAQTAKAAGYEQQSILSKWILPGKTCLAEKHRMGPHDCLALGPSGNGNIGDYVYRNVNTLEDYFKRLQKGSYPIDRGLQMSAQEQIRRYIARAFSFLSVDKDEFKRRFSLTPEQAFPEEMNRLNEKGLIDVDDQKVRLTRAGEVWGQNVCVEFCSRQWREDLKCEERL
jgi:putative oxygen-independent coproporphyrinogen III oxidase